MTEPDNNEWLRAGRISGAHGIKGWVRIQAFTDPPENLLSLSECFLGKGTDKEKTPVELLDGRMQGKGLVARLAGVSDRTGAERLRGQELWIPATRLPTLAPGEYYWSELEGLAVYSDYSGELLLLGEVDHLLETGANDVLVLRSCPGSVDDRERLLPYLPDSVVKAVDLQAGRMLVHWHPDD